MKEIRFNELRLIDEDERTIEGTAIVFNSESEKMYHRGKIFREVILPEAVSDELINNSDIFMLYNHNDNNGVLARSKKGSGTLKINIDERGVHYSFSAPKTTLGDTMLEGVRRGDVTSSSFAFVIESDGEKIEKRDDDYLRTITKFKSLHDFSIVPVPAYAETKVDTRSLDKVIEKDEELYKELEKQKEKQRELEIELEKQKEENFKKYLEEKKKEYLI